MLAGARGLRAFGRMRCNLDEAYGVKPTCG